MRVFLALLLLSVTPLAFAEEDATLDRRIELSKKMHDLSPARDQVSGAIDQIAESQPVQEREAFKSAMRSSLNYRAIERISLDAMVETYTVEELQVMLDYYSNPLAQSASKKQAQWQAKVYPEIVRMLDVAMMRVKTGQ